MSVGQQCWRNSTENLVLLYFEKVSDQDDGIVKESAVEKEVKESNEKDQQS